MDSELPTRIAQKVIEEFENLNVSAGKPTVRPNGEKEWTVLAGLVAISHDDIKVLTLATGVKAMPDQTRKYSQGWILHDMHAEILCLRAFNWLLIEQIRDFELSPLSLLEKCHHGSKHKFRLRKNLQLALYVSEPPCGDMSMSHISSDGPLWEEPPAKKSQIVRGRAHFNRVGVVRTKPGRADSLVTFLKSCSDKLCLKQFTGILNCISSLLVEPIYLDFLVVQRDKYNEKDFHRCFRERLKLTSGIHTPLQVLLFDSDSYKFHKTSRTVSLQLSMVYCVPSKTAQVICNGVKNGAYVKRQPPKPSGASFLCKRKMVEHAMPVIGEYGKYLELKAANEKREERKTAARGEFDSWPETGEDDFDIEVS